VSLRERKRLTAQPVGVVEPMSEVGDDAERHQATDLDPRAANLASQLEALL
jgi:hypothetical protein